MKKRVGERRRLEGWTWVRAWLEEEMEQWTDKTGKKKNGQMD